MLREGLGEWVSGCPAVRGCLDQRGARLQALRRSVFAGPVRQAQLLVHAPVRWNRRIVALGCTGVHLRSGMMERFAQAFSARLVMVLS
jgi:hypothetical protein